MSSISHQPSTDVLRAAPASVLPRAHVDKAERAFVEIQQVLDQTPGVRDEVLEEIEALLGHFARVEDCHRKIITRYMESIGDCGPAATGRPDSPAAFQTAHSNNALLRLRSEISSFLAPASVLRLKTLETRSAEGRSADFDTMIEELEQTLIQLELKADSMNRTVALLEQDDPCFSPHIPENQRDVMAGDVLFTSHGECIYVLEVLTTQGGYAADILASYGDPITIEPDLRTTDLGIKYLLRRNPRKSFMLGSDLRTGCVLVTDPERSALGTESRRWIFDIIEEHGQRGIRALMANSAGVHRIKPESFDPSKYAYIETGTLFRSTETPNYRSPESLRELKTGDLLFFPGSVRAEIVCSGEDRGKSFVLAIITTAAGHSEWTRFRVFKKNDLVFALRRVDGSNRGYLLSRSRGVLRYEATPGKDTRPLWEENTIAD